MDRKKIEAGLIERKRRLTETMGKLSGEAVQHGPRDLGEISSLPQHLADLGSETFEQDRDLELAERASVEIAEIDEALDRLKAGTYGTCEACEGPIPEERLDALPHASLCTGCKAAQEAA